MIVVPRAAFDGNSDLFETDPRTQAWQIAIALCERQNGAGDTRIDEAEIPGIDGNRRARDCGEEPVKSSEHQSFAQPLFASNAEGVRDVVTRLPGVEKLFDRLRRILKVAVHQHDGVAARMREA